MQNRGYCAELFAHGNLHTISGLVYTDVKHCMLIDSTLLQCDINRIKLTSVVVFINSAVHGVKSINTRHIHWMKTTISCVYDMWRIEPNAHSRVLKVHCISLYPLHDRCRIGHVHIYPSLQHEGNLSFCSVIIMERLTSVIGVHGNLLQSCAVRSTEMLLHGNGQRVEVV